MNFFQQKDCDIHNQGPFFVYKMKIPQKWKIPLICLNMCVYTTPSITKTTLLKHMLKGEQKTTNVYSLHLGLITYLLSKALSSRVLNA